MLSSTPVSQRRGERTCRLCVEESQPLPVLLQSPFNTVGALERAKLAVEKHYAVVGVLEDMNTTLTVLENYIPRFFRGATDVYYGKPS